MTSIKSSETVKAESSRLVALAYQLLAPAVLVAVCVACYLPYPFDAVMGDDLNNLSAIDHGQFASNPWQALFGVYADKYRPVFQLTIGALFRIFGFNVDGYIIFNTLLHACNALLVYWMPGWRRETPQWSRSQWRSPSQSAPTHCIRSGK